jgi:hypothetical protein
MIASENRFPLFGIMLSSRFAFGENETARDSLSDAFSTANRIPLRLKTL